MELVAQPAQQGQPQRKLLLDTKQKHHFIVALVKELASPIVSLRRGMLLQNNRSRESEGVQTQETYPEAAGHRSEENHT